jgi:hypothetical protein
MISLVRALTGDGTLFGHTSARGFSTATIAHMRRSDYSRVRGGFQMVEPARDDYMPWRLQEAGSWRMTDASAQVAAAK